MASPEGRARLRRPLLVTAAVLVAVALLFVLGCVAMNTLTPAQVPVAYTSGFVDGHMWVEIVFMLVILKIPVVYLCAVVWWAVRAEPRPPEPALSPARLPQPEPCPWAGRARARPRPLPCRGGGSRRPAPVLRARVARR